MGIIFKKIIIWSLVGLIISANFLLSFKTTQAASISFSPPGKWYVLDTAEGNIVNEIEMTRNGTKETVKWTYSPVVGTGTFYHTHGVVTKTINNAAVYKLIGPGDLISAANLPLYHLFITTNPQKAINLGFSVDPNNFSHYSYLEFKTADNISSYYYEAEGGADTPLGQYLSIIRPYLENSQPAISVKSSSAISTESKNACKGKFLAQPLNKNSKGNPLNELYSAINKRMGEELIKPLNDTEDLDLYHKFYKTEDGLDYSNAYINSNDTPTYRNFIDQFNLSEQGLSWFFTDKEKSMERNNLYTLIGGSAVVLAGTGAITLLPAAVGAAATLGVDYYKNNVNKSMWPKLAKLIAAKVYLDAHMQYDRCIAQNTTDQTFKKLLSDEETNFKALLKMIDQQVADSENAQKEANTGYGDTCGIIGNAFSDMFARALCAILNMLSSLGEWLINSLFSTVFNAYRGPPPILQHLASSINPLSIKHAYAADEISPLTDALTPGASSWKWVIPAWKLVLGLTDLFLVIILLFLGIVNILHIQYDTYAIKKMLPLLIIGTIMANFSLLIMRMLIYFSNILTDSFMGSDKPGTMVAELIRAVNIEQGTGLISGLQTTGALFLSVLFAFFAIAAFFILGVMFYIRYASILLLAIAAPLAFICMAFPPTQSVFKQWWSWITKMIFMKPLALFLIYLAWKIKGSDTAITSITAWIIIVFLVYMAILIPWKLGGWVTSFWGGAMGSLFGTKKGGWARKPVDEWWQRRKDKPGAFVKARLPGLFKGAEKDREEVETLKKIADNRIKQAARKDGSISQLEDMAQGEENTLKTLINDQMNQIRSAELKMPLLIRLIARTSELGQAGKTIKASADAALSGKNIEKRTEDETNLAALNMGIENAELKADLDDLNKDGDGMAMRQLVNGVLQDEYIVDKETGEKKMRKGAAYEIMNRSAQYRQRAAIAASSGDQDEANTLLGGARELERDFGEYARSHSKTKDGRPINYDAFMDDLYAGRVLSLTTQWNMEDSQIESINSPADKNIASIFEGGGGDRLMRVTAQRMQEAMLGKRRGMNVVDLRAWERIMSTLQIQWGRGSNADRATAIGKLIEELANRKFYGEDSYKGGNVLGEQLAGYALTISENPALLRGVLAEQILASRRRGATLPGLENFDIKESIIDGKPAKVWNKDTVSMVLKGMEEAGQLDAKKYLIENPQILSQIGTAAPGISMQDSISYLNFVTDGASRLKILGGGGNPMSNIVAGRDIGSNEWFKPLEVTEKKDIKKIQQEVEQKEIERKEISSESHILTHTTPETFASRITDGAVRNQDIAGVLRNYQGTVLNVLQNLPAILANMKLGNAAISNADFERIGGIIANASANNLGELQAHLKEQGEEISVTLPPGLTDDATGIAQFQKNIRDLLTGIQNINFLDFATKAQTASKYGPVDSPKNTDELKSELAQLTDALSRFDTTVKDLESTGQSMGSFPKQSLEQLATLIAEKSAVIPLREDVLKSNPIQAGDILRKMVMGWAGAIAAKGNNERLTEQNILKNILMEQRKQTISRPTSGTQAGATPTQTPGPGGETPVGETPATPTRAPETPEDKPLDEPE